jgi:signal transduction histidine kinase
LQRVRVDLAELARSRCERLQRTAALRQVSLRVVTEPGQVCYPVQADPDRIAQLLDNLLDNAIRYSPPGDKVTVTLTREGDEVACQVSDAGPGIPAQHLPLIFDRFYRADPARGRNDGGSGLGLLIVKGLALAHGGRVEAFSHEGEGTTVAFWLPAAQPDTEVLPS